MTMFDEMEMMGASFEQMLEAAGVSREEWEED